MTSQREQGLGGGLTGGEDISGALTTLLKALRKSWPIIIAVLIISVGSAVLYTRSLPRVYQATAMIEFDPNMVRPLSDKADMGWASYWDNREYYETQFKIITSDRVLTQVARDLNLQNEPPFAQPAGAAPVPLEAIAGSLRGQLNVDPVKNSRLVLLHVEDTDPARAQHLCDAISRTYVEQNLDNKINQTSDAVVWLTGQLNKVNAELKDNEERLHRFKEDNQLPSTTLNEASNMIRMEMTSYNEQRLGAASKRRELEARHTLLSQVVDNPDKLPASEFLGNAFLGRLRESYRKATEDLRALQDSGKGEGHELVKAAAGRVDEAKQALLGEIANIRGAVARDLAELRQQEGSAAKDYSDARDRAVKLNMKEIEYHRLDRAREQNEKLSAMLLERVKEADLARMMKINNVAVVDPPVEPKSPIRPRPMTTILTSIGLGLLVGIAIAWAREKLDNSVKVPEDVEQKLGLTFIGLLPETDDKGELRSRKAPGGQRVRRRRGPSMLASELVVHEHPLSAVGEAARSIRTNLMFMNPDTPYKRLLVTSAAPAEGKTTVACSIAIAMAQSGQSVCIVDCDMRRPRLHRLFDRVGDVGLTNYLIGDATMDEIAKPTMVKNLSCIPAGPTPPNPADMLHSDRFRKFLAELAERFERVIIDSPPVVPVTDGAILSTLVDTTVYVIRAFKTSITLTRQGLRALHDVDAPVAGTVLNAVDFNKFEYNYYYGYGYYHRREKYAEAPAAQADDENEPAHGGPASPH